MPTRYKYCVNYVLKTNFASIFVLLFRDLAPPCASSANSISTIYWSHFVLSHWLLLLTTSLNKHRLILLLKAVALALNHLLILLAVIYKLIILSLLLILLLTSQIAKFKLVIEVWVLHMVDDQLGIFFKDTCLF